jgi:hypothetical protein
MFEKFGTGWSIIVEACTVFAKNPVFLVPLLLTWCIYAPIILYVKFFHNWDATSFEMSLLLAFGIIFVFSFTLSFSCVILLELLHQTESDEETNFGKALTRVITKDLLPMLPVVLIWSVLSFIIIIVSALFKSKRRSNSSDNFNAENAARTLSGNDVPFSWSRAFFQFLQDGLRMMVYMILPAIAWENLGFTASVKKGLTVFQTHLSQFAAGFLLSEAVGVVLFLPITLLFIFTAKSDIIFPDIVWFIVIIYTAFSWSFSMYIEQMFTAELYMWHMRWEEAIQQAKAEGKPEPLFEQIARPSVLDDIPDFKYKADI